VFAATYDGRPVAVKEVEVPSGPQADNAFRRICHEVNLRFPIRHANIVPLLGACIHREADSTTICIVMPRMKCTLKHLIYNSAGGPPPLHTRVMLSFQVLYYDAI
jgi:V8-like Glu-specific endopeptidase